MCFLLFVDLDIVIGPGSGLPAFKRSFPTSCQAAVAGITAVYNVLDFPVGVVKVTKESEQDQVLRGIEEPYPNFFLNYEVATVSGVMNCGTVGT